MFTRSPMHHNNTSRFFRRPLMWKAPSQFMESGSTNDVIHEEEEEEEEEEGNGVLTDDQVDELERSYQELKDQELLRDLERYTKESKGSALNTNEHLVVEEHDKPWHHQSPRNVFGQAVTSDGNGTELSPIYNETNGNNILKDPQHQNSQHQNSQHQNPRNQNPSISGSFRSNSNQSRLNRGRVVSAPQVILNSTSFSSSKSSIPMRRPKPRVASLDSGSFEDRDLNTLFIVDFGKSIFKYLHRLLIISIKMLHILVSPLISFKLLWISGAIFIATISLFLMSHGISYIRSLTFGLDASDLPESSYQPPIVPPQDISEVTSRLLPLENHLFSLSQRLSVFEPWVKENSEKTEQRLASMGDSLEIELTKIAKVLTTLSQKVDSYVDWTENIESVIKNQGESISQLQRIESSQAEDFNEIFKMVNSWPDMNAKYVDLDRQAQFEKTILQQVTDEKEILAGLIARVDEKLNAIGKVSKFEDNSELILSSLKGEFNDELSNLNKKFERSQLRTEELLSSQRGSIADLNRRLQSVMTNNDRSQFSFENSHSVKSSVQMDRPNFLDPYIGSRVDLRLTSTSFNPYTSSSVIYRAMRDVLGFMGFGRVHFNNADMALYPEVEVGNCWPFHGTTGILAVELPCDVIADSVAVEHPYYRQLIDPNTAPRRISLWGRVDEPKLRTQLRSILPSETVDLPENYMKLFSFEYDLYGGEQWQLFDIPLEIQQLEIPLRNVAFKFEDNWGNPRVSCVYRVQLFGSRISERGSSVYDNEREKASKNNNIIESTFNEGTGFGDDMDI